MPELYAEAANPADARFARDYAAYLETPEGRLRSDLAFANIREFLCPPDPPWSLRALDIGSGTGAIAVRLAKLGIHVTLLDSSPAMLEIADRAAREADVAARVALHLGDASQVLQLLGGQRFDLVVCHNLLEFVSDPGNVLREAAQLLADSRAILSVLVRTRAGEVWKAAIQAGDLAAAESYLAADWARERLSGGKVRLWEAARLQAMLQAVSLDVAAARGVRVIADYLPPSVSRTAEYDRILALERKLGCRPDFAAAARYVHYLTRGASVVRKERA